MVQAAQGRPDTKLRDALGTLFHLDFVLGIAWPPRRSLQRSRARRRRGHLLIVRRPVTVDCQSCESTFIIWMRNRYWTQSLATVRTKYMGHL